MYNKIANVVWRNQGLPLFASVYRKKSAALRLRLHCNHKELWLNSLMDMEFPSGRGAGGSENYGNSRGCESTLKPSWNRCGGGQTGKTLQGMEIFWNNTSYIKALKHIVF